MLKRRRHFARARLPAMTAPHGVAAEAQPPTPADWPEVVQAPEACLWLSMSFIPLPDELEAFLCSKDWRDELARWALSYTPVVSIEPEGALLLEIGSSLRLFGGLQALRLNIQAALREKGLRAVLACAPTARAAHWLARAGRPVACLEVKGLAEFLGPLPLAALGWPVKVQQKLQQMGVRTLAEARRLPRDGFARRIGRDWLRLMDEVFGTRPYLPTRYEAPLCFSKCFEFEDETLDRKVLLDATEVLLQQLQDFLRRHQAAVQSVSLCLGHSNGETSSQRVSGGEALSLTGHLLELAALRFERTVLPAPVTSITLRAPVHLQPVYTTRGLPGLEPAVSADPARQAELRAKLQARLGSTRVHGLGLLAEHRPEKAWYATNGDALPAAPLLQVGQRPLWLLHEPRRIDWRVHGLSLCDAERIESGWWDGHDVRRDYYSVNGPSGSRWWVYRDCRDQHWYLHGLFG